jgi:galactokinase
LYEVSCEELDFIEEACQGEKNIPGARMMGGGFGGCVIAIIKEESIEEITQKIMEDYNNKLGKHLKVYITRIDNGTRTL